MTLDQALTRVTAALVLACLPLTAAHAQNAAKKEAQSKETVVVDFNADAPEMKRAFQEAQRTLDQFLKATSGDNPNLDNVGVRVRFKFGPHTEYLWVMPVGTADGQKFSGQLNDMPRNIKNITLAQEVKFNRPDIVDWMYMDTKAKMLHGHYTTCALMKGAPEADLVEMKQRYGLDCVSKLKTLTKK